MTTEATTEGGQQPAALDEATRAAALAEGISLPPVPGSESNEKPQVDENALPSDGDKPNGEEQVEADPNRPEWLPEKFKTVEEMAEAYKALEQKQGGKQPEVNDGSTPPNTEAGKQAADIVGKAGLEWSKLNDEWKADGKLADASYEAFAKMGISRELVDGHIKGQQAINAQAVNSVRTAAFEAAGDEAKCMEAIGWAAKNWDAKAIAAFNGAVDGPNATPDTARLAVQGLMAARAKSGGNEPTNIAATTKAGSGGTYDSMDQVVRDMSSPRYKNDASYRKAVEQKIARSTKL